MGYQKIPYEIGCRDAVLEPGRTQTKGTAVRRRLPGNIIVVHGVNDVGTSYAAVEEGLCAGLEDRLLRRFKPARYKNPADADKKSVVEDPDAVFYKRTADGDTNSPIIPFYWGYRELTGETKLVNGQKVDRYGNRLDKDLSKGGGPFGNATNTIPDMWNKGTCAPFDPVGDPIRPLLSAPGRMYMILAARRLAALISMIRDYDANETVTLVAHSQGCLLSLLAQAFLMEQGLRPADTLVLTHPPYGLDENANWGLKQFEKIRSGIDHMMEPCYHLIGARQTMHARLQTLVNIVRGVASAKASTPAFASLNDDAQHCGMVDQRWKATADRDNRGKVYLYFCPEDMTVALDNVQGIGWQGVPDFIDGTEYKPEQEKVYDYQTGKTRLMGPVRWAPHSVTRRPLEELGASFLQRVFTDKTRFDPHTGKFEWTLVGQPPHDFPLRVESKDRDGRTKVEDDKAHVEADGRSWRKRLPVATWPVDPRASPIEQRYGIRRINGEALAKPCRADLRGNQIDADKLPSNSPRSRLPVEDRGPCEEVDPIDAAIATASNDLRVWTEIRPEPAGPQRFPAFRENLTKAELDLLARQYNAEKVPLAKTPDDLFTIPRAFRTPEGKVVAYIQESPNAARLRWQQDVSGKSFHGSIIGSRENHRRVTAYDVAIGGGKASSDPNFYAYLCAVADWRLKKIDSLDKNRPKIVLWNEFLEKFRIYWEDELAWRKELIEGNADYYSSGVLPLCLPVLTGKLWRIVISETMHGKRVTQPKDAA
ncbi:T6SS effector phospholipase Tle3 domain-containing protein [Pseudoduganella umbonata]|uniref:DUF3274 domain-containing protein n=1 Tax=Pseudoduganella umbonata TaxID=864828 RepID=A0A4V1EE07_9BURK|nr:DUF3274 domain-containing protein [Pseudoduganella umbonata]MBB3222781.1 hypothetical protein [Pseudoduganella umbonata]QCP12921.1 DUF3274 domain-containing protein [Pseudoduganella umbonata]